MGMRVDCEECLFEPVKRLKINLLEFIKNGEFGILKLGESRECLLNNFPNPDGFEDGDDWKNGRLEIFTYGDIEFHFMDDKLYLIFADYFNILDGGVSLYFEEKWIFEKEAHLLTVEYISQKLQEEKIEFSIKLSNLRDENRVLIRTEEGVEFLFIAEHNEPVLMAVSLLND